MSKLEELRKEYADEEIIGMVEMENLCVLDVEHLLNTMNKVKNEHISQVPRFVIYNIRNQFLRLEKEKGDRPLASKEIIEFIESQEEKSRNRGTYIALATDINAWIAYFRLY